MRTLLAVLVLSVAAVAPVRAQERIQTMAIGYSLATYMEPGGGVAPLGVSLSASTVTHQLGLEADFAFHRDEGLSTLTAAAGPRWEGRGVRATPFMHLMLLLRRDSIPGASNTSVGAMAGLGTDIGRRGGARARLGMDLQVVLDDGRFLKVLRMTAGVAF